MDSSSIVIKVRFGETLRRLNVSINDKKLVLDMVMLKEKIRGLFGFDSNVEFTMTYVDEDGDVVTFADDDDLHDVVRQSLNPLRITVRLNNSNCNGSSGSSTPLKSPQNQKNFEILKSVPEPLLEALAKLPLDLASKASPSAPVFAELVEKLKDAYSSKILPSVANESGHPAAAAAGPPNAKSGSSTVVNLEAGGSYSKKKEKQVQKVTDGSKLKDGQPLFSGKDKISTDGVEKKNPFSFKKKDDISNKPLQPKMPTGFDRLASSIRQNTNGWAEGMLNATNECPFSGTPFSGTPLTTDPYSYSQGPRTPFSTTPFTTDHYSYSQGSHPGSYNPYFNRYGLDNKGMGNIFLSHWGVRCDGCGVHPITGLRFKSKVKDNYDLCNVCFAAMGKATDYMRIERPKNNGLGHHPTPYKGFNDVASLHKPSTLPPRPSLYQPMQAPELKLSQSKLDSQFIVDVNVFDGTIMAPLTAFTKKWRMRNNGSIIWPYGSKLQWIGGDWFGSSVSVDVGIPVDGLPVNEDLEVAVDFIAPALPGRYVSYWMMASPYGQMFGQRVWVLIQVDASMKNLGETPINLNLPPVTSDMEAVKQDRLVDSIVSEDDTSSENASIDLQPKDHETNFPTNDTLIIDHGGASSTMADLSGPQGMVSSPSVFSSTEVGTALGSLPPEPKVTYPSLGLDLEPVDFSATQPIMSSGSASSPTEMVRPLSPAINYREQALVKELEDMGFKQVELNKEILRMNNYDLDKSIDDLCGVLEWDPMLDELQEMGFADDEANRRLLLKNNGSLKRAVMDLINQEKD